MITSNKQHTGYASVINTYFLLFALQINFVFSSDQLNSVQLIQFSSIRFGSI